MLLEIDRIQLAVPDAAPVVEMKSASHSWDRRMASKYGEG